MWQESEGHPTNSAEDAESVHVFQKVKPAKDIHTLYDIVVLFAIQMILIAFIQSKFVVFEVYRMWHLISFSLLLLTTLSRK